MGSSLAPRADMQLFARWGHQVTGWFNSPHELEERPGVYVIATQGFQLPFVLDVGEADNVRFCILNHERRTFWRRNALGSLLYAVIYTQDSDSPFLSEFHRQNVAAQIRSVEQPVFGAHDMFARSTDSL
jgi:hypothetical protein